MTTSPILQPVTIGDLHLKNRIVMAPLTRSRSSTAGVPPDFAADYYGQRASAGLIISEATNISQQAVGYAYTPGIWSDEQIEAWKRIVSTVHANDGCIFLQLWHTGRISHPDLQPGGGLPVSASAVKPEGTAFTMEGMKPHVTPRALETDEIPGIVEDYRRAGRERQARRLRRGRGPLGQQLPAGAVRARFDQQANRSLRWLDRESFAVPA